MKKTFKKWAKQDIAMSETIQLSPGLVAAYKELLTNP